MKKIILLTILFLISSTIYRSDSSYADSNFLIKLRIINDTLIVNLPNAKINQSIMLDLYYKEDDGDYHSVGGSSYTKNSPLYLQKNGDYAISTTINNGKASELQYFNVNTIEVEGKNPDIYLTKNQLMYGMGTEFKGIYTISPFNPPKNRSVTMRAYTIEKNLFKLKYTQKISPDEEMEIPRLKGVREYAFTYSVDGKESDYHVYSWDKQYKYYDADFVVKNFNKDKKDPKENMIKTKGELKKAIVDILSNKKNEFITIKNKTIEKKFKNNEFPNSLLISLFPNKNEREKYTKLLDEYSCRVSYSKKYNSKEIHLFPLKSYIIER